MLETYLPWIIIPLLIVLNGVFVAAEFAIIGAPRMRLEQLANGGNAVAKLVVNILHDPQRQDRYIATAQLGITLASLGLGMYGEHTLAHAIAYYLEDWGVGGWIAAHAVASVLAIIIITYFHIVVGEMVPKSLALQRAESTVLTVTPFMLALRTALFPLVLALNGTGNLILRLFGIRRSEGADQHYSPEELQFLVEQSIEGGMLGKDAGALIREVFDFAELTAGEVMVPRVRVIGLPLGATSPEIATFIERTLHTRYPVYERDLDHIVGIIHVKELLDLLATGATLTKDKVHEPPYLPETADLEVVLVAMRQTRMQLAVILDEYGGTAGIVTLEDLFEEVIGEIDEDPIEEIETTGDGLVVSGSIRLDEAGERLGLELEHDDVDSVGGLVLAILNRPPVVGDVVSYDGVTFEVLSVSNHAVERAKVTALPREEETED